MGVKTLYEYFYKLAYGDKGADKAILVNDCLDVADAAIKANLDGLAGKQPLDAGLTSIAGLTTAANKMIYATALDTYAVTSLTAFARTILDDADASTVRATLNAAVLGANSDITSLTGLTTPLGAAYGGTGVANNAASTLSISGNFATTLTVTNTTGITLPTSGTLATTSLKLSAFAATTSAELAGVISDETGSGALVFGTAPSITTINLTGGQITFPASQNASAGANVLDDYEEGSWTPAIEFGGGTTGITYTLAQASYTKIGNRVFINAFLTLSNKGSSNGDATLTGLPFPCKNTDNAVTSVSLHISNVTFANIPQAIIYSNLSYIILREVAENGTVTSLTDADFSNATEVILSAYYITD